VKTDGRRTRNHEHFPSGSSLRYGVPYTNGERSTCIFCDKPIVFIEGYAFRRDYWRTVRS
jgi:hypothetical protein